MGKAHASGIVGLVGLALIGCKQKAAPPADDIVALPSASAISTTTTTTTPTGVVNAGMADLTPPPSGSNDPFANMNPVPALPAKLPKDPGHPPSLKVTPMKMHFAPGGTVDALVELKGDGTLLFDAKKVGKVAGSKATVKGAPKSVAVRSDGYIVLEAPAGRFMRDDKNVMVTQDGRRYTFGPDAKTIFADNGGGQYTFATTEAPLADDKTKTTALVLVATELGRLIDRPPPDPNNPFAQGGTGTMSGTYTIDLSKARLVPHQDYGVPPPPPPPLPPGFGQ
ncbi:MAG TPA: hypothetical protein VF407_21350 [Polyangiaceae bacterium]